MGGHEVPRSADMSVSGEHSTHVFGFYTLWREERVPQREGEVPESTAAFRRIGKGPSWGTGRSAKHGGRTGSDEENPPGGVRAAKS